MPRHLLLLALFACHDHDSPLDMDDWPLDPNTTEAFSTTGATPHTDARGDTLPAADFRWSDEGGRVELSPKLNSAIVERHQDGAWITRAAGDGAARGTIGIPGGMRARSPAPSMMMEEPMADRDGASAAISPSPRDTSRLEEGGPSAPLRAGSTDDNADLSTYLEFLDTWSASAHIPRPDVSGRRFIRVTDALGQPVPAARVSVIDNEADRVIWSGTTYGDGRAPFYPELSGTESPRSGWTVQASDGRHFAVGGWDGNSDTHTLILDDSADASPIRLDVVFLIDTTGSMGDEIARVKDTLLRTTDRLRSLDQEFDLRYGAVLYRDLGDAYLTRVHPLSPRVQQFSAALQDVRADGGGDGPESLNQGMAVAVGEMEWREDAAKLVFLIADAPPHMDYQQDTCYTDSALAALHRGIKIHTVAASGLDNDGTLVFREIAQLTRGEFIFIEYGSVAASAASHGVGGQVQSNNLDAILFREIKNELEGWGHDPTAVAAR